MKNARQKSGENVLARLGVGTVHPSIFFLLLFTTSDDHNFFVRSLI